MNWQGNPNRRATNRSMGMKGGVREDYFLLKGCITSDRFVNDELMEEEEKQEEVKKDTTQHTQDAVVVDDDTATSQYEGSA